MTSRAATLTVLACDTILTLLLAGALGAHLAMSLSARAPLSGTLIAMILILIAIGLDGCWRGVRALIALAVEAERTTEQAWSAAADRIRAGDAP